MAYLKVVSLRLSPREMKSSSIPRLLVRESRVKRLDALQDKLISMLLWKRGTLRFTQTAHFPFSYFWWLGMVLLISVASWRFPENQLLCIQALSFQIQVLDEILAMAICFRASVCSWHLPLCLTGRISEQQMHSSHFFKGF